MSGFTAADVPDLTGRTVIVTGANSGIGPGFANWRGAPAPCSRSKAAVDDQTATRLWQMGETLTGAQFPL